MVGSSYDESPTLKGITMISILTAMIAAILSTMGPGPIPPTPCPWEDSMGPCFWDASERGNGEGHDFWVDDQGRGFIPFRDVDGHTDCWIHIGHDTSEVVCRDGYRTTS